jgi:choline dehydrogenase
MQQRQLGRPRAASTAEARRGRTVLLTMALVIALGAVVLLFWMLIGQRGPAHATDYYADIVVVGSGAGGATLAANMAQGGYSVLLLEAGSNFSADVAISDPTASGALVTTRAGLYFAPVAHPRVVTDAVPAVARFFPVPLGRCLGGGTCVNGMQWVRGTDTDWDATCALMGDDAWCSTAIHGVYEAIERLDGLPSSGAARGRAGPVDVRAASFFEGAATAFANAVVAALPELSLSVLDDYNLPGVDVGAFVDWQLTQQPGAHDRTSMETAYRSTLLGPNVRVFPHTTASRVLFEPGTTRAESVLGVSNGLLAVFHARQVVVIAAGAQSSLLLERSGVGPASFFTTTGQTPVVVNANVGEHVGNHPIITLTGLVPPSYSGPLPVWPVSVPAGAPDTFAVGGPVRGSPVVVGPTTVLDVRALYSGAAFTPFGLNGRNFEMIGIAANGSFTIATLLLHARSESSFHARNLDPLSPPAMTLNYFTDPFDRDAALEAVRQMYRILTTGLGLNVPAFPSGVSSNATILNYVYPNYAQAYHWTHSCRMSPTAATGVVDSDGRVHGTQRLRVADVSILPFSMGGNPQAPGMAVGLTIAKKLLAQIPAGTV